MLYLIDTNAAIGLIGRKSRPLVERVLIVVANTIGEFGRFEGLGVEHWTIA